MRLTKDKAWELCLKQWEWIIKEKRANPQKYIAHLKREWLAMRGFIDDSFTGCFFCDYDSQMEDEYRAESCVYCPAKEFDPNFKCIDPSYDYEYKPEKFYKKLLSLNRKRLAKRRK
jgi:hypothetical protein